MQPWTQTMIHWSRTLHVIATMLGLILILLFAGTGLLLNHPSWTAGSLVEGREEAGVVPAEWLANDLQLEEYLRGQFHLRGRAELVREAEQVQLAWRAPGFAADAKVVLPAGTVALTVENQGLLAVILDLHTGNHAGPVWGWVMDVTAVFLLLAGLTGLILTGWSVRWQKVGLWSAGVGLVVVLALAGWAFWVG
jgi:hypothetical protein